MSPERPPRKDPLRRRHPLEYPVILGLLAVAGLLAVVNGVFFPGPWAEEPKRPIDPKTAGQYVGKTVLIGVSKLGDDDQPLQRSEWVGRIARLSREEGIVVDIAGDAPCVLPPDLDYLEPAQPGVYELKSTGQKIENPDFMTTWTSKEELAPPRWTPEWVARGYWSSRLYSAFLRLRGWWFTSANT